MIRDTTELANRIEASLRGLEYHETLKDGTFKAFNHFTYSRVHIDGKRHERSVGTENLLSALYRAHRHSFENVERGRTHMARLNGLCA